MGVGLTSTVGLIVKGSGAFDWSLLAISRTYLMLTRFLRYLLPIEIAQKCLRRTRSETMNQDDPEAASLYIRQETKVLAFMLTAFQVQPQPKEHAEVVLHAR